MSKSSFEANGGTYRLVNGYRIPNLTTPDDGLGEEVCIGIWRLWRLNYLKKSRRILYVNLLTSCKLAEHLREIDILANERRELIIR